MGQVFKLPQQCSSVRTATCVQQTQWQPNAQKEGSRGTQAATLPCAKPANADALESWACRPRVPMTGPPPSPQTTPCGKNGGQNATRKLQGEHRSHMQGYGAHQHQTNNAIYTHNAIYTLWLQRLVWTPPHAPPPAHLGDAAIVRWDAARAALLSQQQCALLGPAALGEDPPKTSAFSKHAT